MWVIAVLGGLVALFVLVLCVPVDAVFDWDSSARPGFRFKLAWLFGLISLAPGRKREKQPVPERRKKKKKKRPGFGTIIRTVRIRGLFRQVLGLMIGLFRQIKLKELRGEFRLGLTDPADAAFVFGARGMLYPLLGVLPWRGIRIEPFFGEEISLQGSAHGVVRLQPIRLMPPLLRFALSRPGLSLARSIIFDK